MLPRKRPDSSMTLTVCNEHSAGISVAIAYYNPNQCAKDGKWRKVGWYNIAPGACRIVYNANLADVNSRWLYYARTYDRTIEWAGNYRAYVIDEPFRMCWNEPSLDPGFSRAYKVGFRLFDINSYDSYTLRLHR